MVRRRRSPQSGTGCNALRTTPDEPGPPAPRGIGAPRSEARVKWPRVSRRASIDRYYLLQTRWVSVFLHRFKRSDTPRTLHSHPWNWVSFIFGEYTDERVGSRKRRRWLNWCPVGVPHRVVLTSGPVWTICVHGPRKARWAVYDLHGKLLEEEPWRGMGNIARQEYM